MLALCLWIDLFTLIGWLVGYWVIKYFMPFLSVVVSSGSVLLSLLYFKKMVFRCVACSRGVVGYDFYIEFSWSGV